MIRCLLAPTLVLAATTALAQTPIPRVGDSCPTGTYKSGDYCKPFKSSSADGQTIIEKSGKQCPQTRLRGVAPQRDQPSGFLPWIEAETRERGEDRHDKSVPILADRRI